ncbi:hypothetical protein SYJ56_25595, partial [Algoriphagus sp. D3-2-R+10]|uniref:hypothetical protein n=1 Tax=Algoriphagus aurantiacus TaxID=3103948 RepID=UPI002B3D9925
IITKKGMDRASSDVGLIFTAYNLRRIFNLVGPEVLKAYLKALWRCFLAVMDLLDAPKTPEYKTRILAFNSGYLPKAA